MQREEQPTMATKLEQIAVKARCKPNLRFTSLAHHITRERVQKNLLHIPKRSAAGVDGQTVAGKFGLALEPTKTKLVEFGRFAQRHAGKRGRNRPETIYFLGLTLYCTRNQKGNFKVGMRTEKAGYGAAFCLCRS